MNMIGVLYFHLREVARYTVITVYILQIKVFTREGKYVRTIGEEGTNTGQVRTDPNLSML